MRRRLLTFGIACAAATLMAMPAAAQIAVPRHPGGGYYGGRGSVAYDNGYREGLREGERDARDRKDYGYKRDDAYEDADRGYRSSYGSKDLYRREFRRGYEDGYDAGYRRYGYGGGGGYYPNRPGGGYGYPGGGYGYPGGGAYGSRQAFDNGYRDGYDAGVDDARRNRRFDPTSESRYRSATRGYSSRYGSRAAYQNQYRDGFRAGYEEGYRDSRRYNRR